MCQYKCENRSKEYTVLWFSCWFHMVLTWYQQRFMYQHTATIHLVLYGKNSPAVWTYSENIQCLDLKY